MSERLGIVGSGAIACGVAAVGAQVGEVVLCARTAESAERARAQLEKLMARMDSAPAHQVEVTCEPAALSVASFLIEAVAEDLAIKGEVLGELGRNAGRDAILATTTSSLSIEALARASGRAERFTGLHVFNPVPRMDLVELVFPTAATDETRERARALCLALGKRAVEVPDVPGFVVNRLLFPYLFSAVLLLEETGMAAADVDECMRLGAGHPMGPLALLDLVGLDVSLAIGETIGTPIPSRLRELVQAGNLGRKSGAGFHPY